MGARIFMWTAQRLEIQGADVQLYCRAAGTPRPTVTWYDRDGLEITPDRLGYKVKKKTNSNKKQQRL